MLGPPPPVVASHSRVAGVWGLHATVSLFAASGGFLEACWSIQRNHDAAKTTIQNTVPRKAWDRVYPRRSC